MARGDKSKYTDKQKRKAEHIEEGYEKRGVSKEEAEKRAWSTVNATHRGGEKPGGGGYGKPENKEPSRTGGKKGGKKSAKKSGGSKKSGAKKSASKKSSSKKSSARKSSSRK